MEDNQNQLYDLINSIPVNEENEEMLTEVKQALEEGDLQLALEKLNSLPGTSTEDLHNL